VLYSFELLVICRSRSGSILSALPVEFIALSSFIAPSSLALGSLEITAPDLLLVLRINDLLGSTALNSSL